MHNAIVDSPRSFPSPEELPVYLDSYLRVLSYTQTIPTSSEPGVSYKRGTAKIIRWLSSNAEPGIGRSYLNSIRELRYFADCIIVKDVEVPEEIMNIYRRTIQARKQLGNFYKRYSKDCEKESTESHAYFNDVFEQVFYDLLRCRKRRNAPGIAQPKRLSSTSVTECSNTYCYLDVADPNEEILELSERCPPTRSSIQPDAERKNDSEPGGSAIEDDSLDEMSHLFTYLVVSGLHLKLEMANQDVQQLDFLVSTIKQSYHQAAEGLLPLMVAALSTNIAYQCGNILGLRLQKYNVRNPTQFEERYRKCMQALGIGKALIPDLDSQTNPQHLIFTRSLGPQSAWKELCLFRESLCYVDEVYDFSDNPSQNHRMPSQNFPYEDPVKFLTQGTAESDIKPEEADQKCLQALLRGLYQALKQYKGPQSQTPFTTPLMRDFDSFLQESKSGNSPPANHCGLCFGLHLLLESYKSYCGTDRAKDLAVSQTSMIPRSSSHARKPRLQSLRFAADLKENVKYIVKGPYTPCTCQRVNNFSVVDLAIGSHALLESFITTKRFDFFYQAPWVSGVHAMEGLARGADCGWRVWHYGYFVGTTLHVYNALMQAKLMEATAIPILESLCDIYEDALFMGKRSAHNVLSCWQRWSGGKVRVPTHRRRTHDIGNTRKWNFCSVADSSHGGNNANRSFNPAKVSLFSLLAESQCIFDDKILAWVYLPKNKRKKYQAKDIAKAKKTMEEGSISKYVDRMQAAVLDDFRNSEVPVARINYFAVYRACLETMHAISDANHEEDPGYIYEVWVPTCIGHFGEND
ncbi:hypothetical protein B7494_g4046 [Chlorociboria aeruginascens]|nr:hypothetical protein B7494_g4046 [Chlorociboria aeruginascens]